MHVSLSGKIKVSPTPTTEDIECDIGGICPLLLLVLVMFVIISLVVCMHVCVAFSGGSLSSMRLLFALRRRFDLISHLCLTAHLLVDAGPWDLIEFIETANLFCLPYCKELYQ